MVAPSVAQARVPLRIDGSVVGSVVAAVLLLLPVVSGQHGLSWVDGGVIDDLPLRGVAIAGAAGAAALAVLLASGRSGLRPIGAVVAALGLVIWIAAIAVMLVTNRLPGIVLGTLDGPGIGGGWFVVAWAAALLLASLTVGPARGAILIGDTTILFASVVPTQPFQETLTSGSYGVAVVPMIVVAAAASAYALSIGRHRRRRWSIPPALLMLAAPVIVGFWIVATSLGGGYVAPTGGLPLAREAAVDLLLVGFWWVAAGLLATGASPADQGGLRVLG